MAVETSSSGGSQPWTLGDVVDFERTIAAALPPDSETTLREDGRRLAKLYPDRRLEDVPRRQLLHRWLNLRRDTDKTLFGREIDRVFRFLGISSWLCGSLAGFLGASGYLEYNGSKPINVVWFFIWLVVCPWLTTLLGWAVSQVLRDEAGPKLLGGLLGTVLSRASPRYHTLWHAWSEELRRHGSRLAPIAVWPLMGLTQRFASGFAMGALLALVTHVIGVDMAFGWESTLNVGARFIHALTRWIATPWLWLYPEGAPSFEQVRDSRYTHLLGIEESTVEATRSWWPFLVGCLAAYTVLPRLLLVQWSEWQRKRALAQLGFRRSIDGELARGLLGPLFVTEDETPDDGLEPPVTRSNPPSPSPAAWMVLIAEGFSADDDSVKSGVLSRVPGSVSLAVPFEIDFASGNRDALDVVRRSADGLVIAIPSSTDPLEAMRETLAAFAEASEGRDRFIALFGREERIDLWQLWARKAPKIDYGIISIPSP